MTNNIPPIITTLSESIRDAGGRALLVGGCVRDMLLDREPTDFDIEVYGLAPEKLTEVAKVLGEVIEAGKAFGILKLRVGDLEIDLGIPRSDSKVADGHRGFDIRVDPLMSPADAVRRRDFTINTIMMDPLTDEIIDPTGGVVDLEKRILLFD